MNPEIIKAYNLARRETRGYLGAKPAINALREARAAVKNNAARFPRYAGEVERLELPRGEYVEMRLEPDCDSDIFERLGLRADDYVPADVRDNASEGWQDREGRIVFDADARGWRRDWRWLETDQYPLAQRIADRRRHMSRHAAWLHARESIAREFDYFRKVSDAGYVGYTATLYGADGDEIDSDSCWGFEADGDYPGLECLAAAESMAASRAKYWTAETEKARERNRETRRAFAALATEYRAARNVGPAVCDAIRARLAALRSDFQANVRTIVGGAA